MSANSQVKPLRRQEKAVRSSVGPMRSIVEWFRCSAQGVVVVLLRVQVDHGGSSETDPDPVPKPLRTRRAGANLTVARLSRPNGRVRTKRPALSPAALLVVALGVLVSAAPAAALPNDIHLVRLLDDDGAGGFTQDDAAFRAISRELGLVMTPTSMQVAETTGHSGFDFGLDYSFHTMRFEQDYWRAREERNVPLLMTLGARARKGFVLPVPLTSEVEFGAEWLIDSQLLNLGTNVRVALNEGFRWIPDLAVQAGINRMVGNDELDLLTVTAGGQVSKGFGIAGSFNVNPFVGYQSIWVNASSRIVDANPIDTANVEDNFVFTLVPLAQNRMDRLSVGLRLVVAVVSIAGGVDIDFIDPVDGDGVGGQQQTLLHYTIRAGVLL